MEYFLKLPLKYDRILSLKTFSNASVCLSGHNCREKAKEAKIKTLLKIISFEEIERQSQSPNSQVDRVQRTNKQTEPFLASHVKPAVLITFRKALMTSYCAFLIFHKTRRLNFYWKKWSSVHFVRPVGVDIIRRFVSIDRSNFESGVSISFIRFETKFHWGKLCWKPHSILKISN